VGPPSREKDAFTALEFLITHLEHLVQEEEWAQSLPLASGERRVVGDIIVALEAQVSALLRLLERIPISDEEFMDASVTLLRLRYGKDRTYWRCREAAEGRRLT
jgi:hypothetical protein